MHQKKSRRKTEQKTIAKERILKLFDQAEKSYKKNISLANRYITIARKIAMKSKVRIPPNLKRKFCKHCYKYLTPNNSRIRIRDQKIIIYCENCKKYTRIPIKQKKYK